MDLRIIAALLSDLALACGFAMIFPAVLGYIDGDGTGNGFLQSLVLAFLVGHGLYYYGQEDIDGFTTREGTAITVLGWLMIILLGTTPYMLTGTLSPLDSLFESTSGFTSTGATVITDLDHTPRSILLWRSISHWVGGLGIIVIFIALLPQIGRGAVHIYNAEISGAAGDRVLPRIQNTAAALFKLYSFFTFLALVTYMCCGMDFFTAINHAFSTTATGGFSTYDASVGYFDNNILYMSMMVFMLICSCNFGIYIAALRHGPGILFRNTELRCYLGMLLFIVIAITIDITVHMGASLSDSLINASFQTISISSTAGFITADYDAWPPFSRMCMLLLMFVGGCAGSTSGGLKMVRVILLFKMVYIIIQQRLHTGLVANVKINGRELPQNILFSVGRFFFMYIGFFLVVFGLLLFDDMPVMAAMGAAASTLSGAGPGFDMVGATSTYSDINPFSKLILCISMLGGRLEILSLLALMQPSFWRRKQGW